VNFDESTWIWLIALAVAALVVAFYVLADRRRNRQVIAQLSEARRLGIDQPTGQYPYIDPSTCIGCGGCVRACPEGDVLGLVGGLATVVNGARCIGISQCERACPVGAIEIRVGPLKSRADVPQMTDERETNIPGVYIAGELGGLALIRNAVEQGRETVHSIAQRIDSQSKAADSGKEPIGAVDLAIVGAGPSGLSAALAAVERGLSYVVLEQESDFGGTIFQYPRRKLTHTQPVELPLYGTLKRAEYSKEDLLELFEQLVQRYKLELRFGERVEAIDRGTDAFTVRTAKSELSARHVLLALGRRGTPRKLGVAGEELPKVMYQVRDAEQYKHQRILCVGGGDSAIEAAMGLARQPGNKVMISYRKEQFFRIKKKNKDLLAKLVKRRRIELLMSSQLLEIEPEQVRIKTADGELLLANDYVFVLIGGVPPFPLLRDIGIRFGGEPAVAEA